MTRVLLRLAVASYAALIGLSSASGAQIPEKFENLKVLPKDIPRDTLIQIMRGFSFALGVRCQFCHATVKEDTVERTIFKSDDKEEKRTARFMIGMVRDINTKLLP